MKTPIYISLILVFLLFFCTKFGRNTTIRDVYVSAIAEDVVNIKRRIAIELNRHGIQTVLTKPEELNIDTLNKYLELKSKGMI